VSKLACAALLGLALSSVDAAHIAPWPLPASGRSAQPNLVATQDAILLSWIEALPEGGHALRYARDGGRGFGAPREIARGNDWFVNWADFPALTVLSDGSLAAHFLRKNGAAAYAYDVRLTRSRNGRRWSAPITVHDDGTRTEHGFVSLWPGPDGQLGMAWLDGRDSGGGGHDGGHGSGGAMSLRAAHFDARHKRQESPLDARTCDCCQTDVAQAAAGPVLVYRDRDANEVRDISITRWREGKWSAPTPVHADGWIMPACPVNGPAVAAHGKDVYVAWYTAASGMPEVRVARSHDDARSFAAPLSVALGSEVLGRVDLALDDESIHLLWLSEDARTQTLWLARFARDLSQETERLAVATLARGRGTGFPRLAPREGVAHLVWTDIIERQPTLRGARVRFEPRDAVSPPTAAPE
jgi:hypothetical protein